MQTISCDSEKSKTCVFNLIYSFVSCVSLPHVQSTLYWHHPPEHPKFNHRFNNKFIVGIKSYSYLRVHDISANFYSFYIICRFSSKFQLKPVFKKSAGHFKIKKNICRFSSKFQLKPVFKKSAGHFKTKKTSPGSPPSFS